MARIGLLLWMLLGFIKVSTSQTPAPLTQSQLLKLQSLSVAQLTNTLSRQGWQVAKNQKNQLTEYFNYSLGYNLDQWEPGNRSQWEGTLYVYYRKGYPNLLVYQTTRENFENMKPTYIEAIKEQNVEISIVIRYGLAIEFRNYFNDNSSKKYSILCYDIGSVKDLISKDKRMAEQTQREEKAAEEKKSTESTNPPIKTRGQNYDYYLQAGNTFFDKRDYKKALYHYQMAKGFILPGEKQRIEDLDGRIAETRSQMVLMESASFKKAAETFLKERKYEEALLNYQKAFQLNPEDKEAKERIACLEEVTRTNRNADTITSYRKINPKEFKEFQDLNTRALNYLMNSEKNTGFLNYSINIKFDNKGKNQSSLKINSISDDRLIFYLTDISASYIQVSLINYKCIGQKIPVASMDMISYDLKWKSQPLQVKAGKTVEFQDGSFTAVNRDSMIAFIKRQPEKYGFFTFQVLDKNLNGKKLQDISLVDYRNNRLSGTIFLPGLSDIRTGEVHRGRIKLTTFLLSAALSIGSKLYSDQQYQKYKAPENGQNIRYYNHANLANKVFLISGGVAATLCLYDITSFFIGKTGAKNKGLKSDLKNGPIPITESSF